MVKQSRVAGVIELKVNGDLLRAVGDFTYNLGQVKREAAVGATGIDGFKEMPQVPFIEGTVRNTNRTDTIEICQLTDSTVTLALPNGDVIVLRNAWFAGEGAGHTEEGTFDVRFEGISCEVMKAA